ncbi:anti-sigma 24 factor [Microvirga tunisiensis]|uniref:Anti-sigma 24 factor n=2 Tax=Pannonibacter tanglangensis TaxID=2750084 RepID=A0A7X5J9X6_9HYPH|nr:MULTISPECIES: FecR domain-containing protein [unclassified Pannonibacter]NBN64928.1 anti-sigma 24 factor [Pannonibacter sp. XCT-34]NBN79437.1 anti-sigma 24 factor [Pannonibacter sp. XCT-53]
MPVRCSHGSGLLAVGVLVLCGLAATPVPAQTLDGCTRSERTDPARVVFTCANGLVIEAEAAAVLSGGTTGGTPRPDTLRLTEDAVLVELPSGSGPFQILTPHAIASVRGTVYAVDVEATKTAVFVERGAVTVAAAAGSAAAVTLGPGEGVEVTPGAALEVKRWPQEKVDRLMARFGR